MREGEWDFLQQKPGTFLNPFIISSMFLRIPSCFLCKLLHHLQGMPVLFFLPVTTFKSLIHFDLTLVYGF